MCTINKNKKTHWLRWKERTYFNYVKKEKKKEKNKTKTGLVDQIERWNEKKKVCDERVRGGQLKPKVVSLLNF